MHLFENACEKTEGSTKLGKSLLGLNVSDYIEEFFVGITHDKNMGRMATYFDTEVPDLEVDSPDFFKKFNLTQQKTLEKTYRDADIKEENLVFPIFTNYKMVSLDWSSIACVLL